MIRKSKKSALEQYQVNAGGEYVYTGAYISWEKGGKERKKTLIKLWGLSLAMTVGAIGAGCVPAPGLQDTFYVLLPLMVEIILAVSCLWGLGQLTAGGENLKEYVFTGTVEKLPGRYTAVVVFAAAAALLELLYLLLHGEFSMLMLLFWGLEVLSAGTAILTKKEISGLKWKK